MRLGTRGVSVAVRVSNFTKQKTVQMSAIASPVPAMSKQSRVRVDYFLRLEGGHQAGMKLPASLALSTANSTARRQQLDCGFAMLFRLHCI